MRKMCREQLDASRFAKRSVQRRYGPWPDQFKRRPTTWRLLQHQNYTRIENCAGCSFCIHNPRIKTAPRHAVMRMDDAPTPNRTYESDQFEPIIPLYIMYKQPDARFRDNKKRCKAY